MDETEQNELEEFRRQWRTELRVKDGHTTTDSDGAARANDEASSLPISSTSSSSIPAPSAETGLEGSLSHREAIRLATLQATQSRPAPSHTIQATATVQHRPSAPAAPKAAHTQSSQAPSSSAVDLYASAVLAERQGRLNDALRGYKAAFRKDDNVDRLYHQHQLRKEKEEMPGTSAISGSTSKPQVPTATTGRTAGSAQDDTTENELVFEFNRTLQMEPDYVRKPDGASAEAGKAIQPEASRKRALAGRLAKSATEGYTERLLVGFRDRPYIPASERLAGHETETHASIPSSNTITLQEVEHSLQFQPRHQYKPFHLHKLPDEIILHILSFVSAPSPHARYPDVSSLERGFALTCRKARIMTLHSFNTWKRICYGVYKPPFQIEAYDVRIGSSRELKEYGHKRRDHEAVDSLCHQQYGMDWRLLYIEHPRLRFDGVYISQITYFRKGAHDGTAYYDPTHCVTYYRYLVFLHTGEVVSLLSNDLPAAVVPTLLSTESKKPHSGYTVGRWELRQASSSGSTSGASIVTLSSLEDPRILDEQNLNYSFEMQCRLKSTSRGRMNKLEMLELRALNKRTGEGDAIPVRQVNGNMPAFYFSRVRSYD